MVALPERPERNRSMTEHTDGRTAAAGFPSVSVVIPARDASKTIATTLDSVLSQEYAGSVEVIVADGSGTPGMAEIIHRQYPTVKLVPNPDQELLPGIIRCSQAATGQVLARCDAHTSFTPGYLCRAVELLQKTGAANVGGATATCRRHLVRAGRGDGDDHATGGRQRLLPDWRPCGPGRYRLPGCVPAQSDRCDRWVQPFPGRQRRLRNQLSTAKTRRNSVVRAWGSWSTTGPGARFSPWPSNIFAMAG